MKNPKWLSHKMMGDLMAAFGPVLGVPDKIELGSGSRRGFEALDKEGYHEIKKKGQEKSLEDVVAEAQLAEMTSRAKDDPVWGRSIGCKWTEEEGLIDSGTGTPTTKLVVEQGWCKGSIWRTFLLPSMKGGNPDNNVLVKKYCYPLMEETEEAYGPTFNGLLQSHFGELFEAYAEFMSDGSRAGLSEYFKVQRDV